MTLYVKYNNYEYMFFLVVKLSIIHTVYFMILKLYDIIDHEENLLFIENSYINLFKILIIKINIIMDFSFVNYLLQGGAMKLPIFKNIL